MDSKRAPRRIRMTDDAYKQLRIEALRRDVTPGQLIALMLEQLAEKP